MAKKQLNPIKEAAAAPVKAARLAMPRITAAKHKKSPAIVESPATQSEISHEAIASIAYGYWQSRGGQGGNALDDWFRAEAELRHAPIY